MRTFEPIDDYVIVEVPKPQDIVTESGLTLATAENKDKKPKTGTVIAIGPGCYEYGVFIPMALKVGDHVIFEAYAPEPLALSPEEENADILYYAVSQSSVIAKIID